MGKFINLTGKRFGRLLVTSFSHIGNGGDAHWNVICDCENEKVVNGRCLRAGDTKSCGCLNIEVRKGITGKLNPNWGKNDLTGKEFGRLFVIKRLKRRVKTHAVYLCKCACGNFIEVIAGYLVEGNTKSCGCLRSDMLNARIGELHPNWNPNLTDEDRETTRTYPGYKEWRTSVYKRDNYTCQKCGDNSGGNLIAHHIEGHAKNKELRLELSNGITLCKKHHDELHHLYGYDVGRENLNKFIK